MIEPVVVMTRNRFLGAKDLQEKFCCSTATGWRISQSEGFPNKIKLPTNATGWWEAEVDTWIAQQERVPKLDEEGVDGAAGHTSSHEGSKRGRNLRGTGRRPAELRGSSGQD